MGLLSNSKSKYEKFDKLGEGTYAAVFKGRNVHTGDFVAMKEINIDKSEGTPSTGLREVALVKSLQGSNKNIIKLIDIEHTDERLLLVFELCKQDLKKFMDQYRRPSGLGTGGISSPGPVPPEIARDLTYQMMDGIRQMHDGGVIHRDLKPQNLLLTPDRTLRIADFGLARAIGTPTGTYSNEVVTLWYRAPDVLMGSKSYGRSIDVWSAGCIMAEMLMGYPLFRGRDNKDQVLAIFKILGTPKVDVLETICDQSPEIRRPLSSPAYPPVALNSLIKHASPEAIDLLYKMLTIDPVKRITAADALNHEYFKVPRR